MVSKWEDKVKTDIVNNVKAYASEIIENIKKYNKVCVFGAGEHGKNWVKILLKCGVRVECICDNNHALWGKKVYGNILCCSPQELKDLCPGIIIIAVRKYKEILKQLQEMGFSSIYIASTNTIGFMLNYTFADNNVWIDNLINKVLEVMQFCDDDLSEQICYETLYQWFVDENSNITYCGKPYFISELEKRRDEKFIDAGAYVGDTIEEFLKNYKDGFSKIYAFEMDSTNFHILKKKTETLDPTIKGKIHIINKGLWNERKTLYYNSNCQTSKISDEGEFEADMVSLDDILAGKEVTFIKMDIEGAELKALEGCKSHIVQYKPQLAISIYHSPEDFYSIPQYIKELNPGYKIMIRHHSTDESDTVCYAY